MRHRKRGRVLGRSPSHRKALLQNLTKALILTADPDAEGDGAPKVKGRIITTMPKAKEVRSMVEKCITIARKGLAAQEKAAEFSTSAERGTEAWNAWRKSDNWNKWAQAMAPAVNARRRVVSLLNESGSSTQKGDKRVVRILFDHVAPQFVDRPGGYTRVVKLAKPRLGDAGQRALLEFVGIRDRVSQKSTAPSFDDQPAPATAE